MSFANPEYKAVQAILNGSIVKASDKPLDKKYWDQFVVVRDHFEERLTSIPTISSGDEFSLAD